MAVSSGSTHDIVLRPGEGGKLDLGHVLVDAGAFALNTTTSHIYTKQKYKIYNKSNGGRGDNKSRRMPQLP